MPENKQQNTKPIKTVCFRTFGCKVNQYETQALMEEFARHGFTVSTNAADIYLINTCSVTARADKRAREAVRHIKKENPGAKIALTGCLPQLNADKVKTWGVDWVVPQDKKSDIIRLIKGDEEKRSLSPFDYRKAHRSGRDGGLEETVPRA